MIIFLIHLFPSLFQACKAMAPAYYHLATQHQDTLFVDVPCSHTNQNLHFGLGVPSLPYGHIYQPGLGLVEEMRMVKKEMPDFEQKLCALIQEHKDSAANQND